MVLNEPQSESEINVFNPNTSASISVTIFEPFYVEGKAKLKKK